ncbi:DUF2147 domain-containing protein [Paracoccus sp. 1_MG-2023]|uniref:DUF2147 domain-containing protein n=1 Tax=unclassified Paracoccus (in: a-proteobacteria) TaxID=2688777 RepID=UPI001C098F51|nr:MULTISPECIES: DUF2147 domain-containing protein [unclassified Paracoccus (in: a-proteobacteria)]MBU2956631.1 DUF2147 domain-containing protein [Paracoccus sp. C2R09]MDO6668737.1 DUF2147 domain-containing protein [Paracoccus sp. 1_MG-2023]
MRQFILAAGFALAAGAASADPIEGIWQTQPDEGAFAHVTIAPCGGAFCGTINRTFKDGAEYRSPNIGRQIVIDMAPRGGGAYEGRVWRPANDKVYNGKASVSGDRMSLSGCVAGGLICKSQTWVKVQ